MKTLLQHLLAETYEPQHFLMALKFIETAKRDIETTKKEIAEPGDEWEHLFSDSECTRRSYSSQEEYIEHLKECLASYKDDLREWTEERDMMLEDWQMDEDTDLEEEIELVKAYVNEQK